MLAVFFVPLLRVYLQSFRNVLNVRAGTIKFLREVLAKYNATGKCVVAEDLKFFFGGSTPRQNAVMFRLTGGVPPENAKLRPLSGAQGATSADMRAFKV